MASSSLRIVVIGLGYVGLPLAVALARQVRRHRLRHRRGPDRRASGRPRPDRARSRTEALAQSSADADRPSRGLRAAPTSTSSPCRRRSTRATARTSARCIAATRMVAGLIDPDAAADDRLRKHGLSRRHRGDLRARDRARRRPQARPRLPPRLQPRADQSGRPRAQHRQDHQGHRRRGRGGRRAARANLRRDHQRRGVPRGVDQGRRGGQGDRERPARHQHRLHERGRADLLARSACRCGTCSTRRGPSGISSPSSPAWSAATASASIPIISAISPSSSATTRR